MNTAFDLRNWAQDSPGTGYFPFPEVISKLAETRPGQGFRRILADPKTSDIKFKSWLPFGLSSALKRSGIQVLVNHDHHCSFGINIPQIIFITTNALNISSISKQINKAAVILVPSNYMKQEIEERFTTDNKKIQLITPAAVSSYTTANAQTKDDIKMRISNGKEFFLCDIHNDDNKVLFLLQAFSLFKKRHQSEMKLVFWDLLSSTVTSKLRTYKHREDVIIVNPVQSIANREELHSASYCVIHLKEEPFAIPRAMRSGSLLILPVSGSAKEITGGNALFIDANSPTDIAARMMEVYTNESKRSVLISQSIDKSRNYTCEQAANDLWNAIVSAQHE